jgi:DNA-binding response OmpR family regulator
MPAPQDRPASEPDEDAGPGQARATVPLRTSILVVEDDPSGRLLMSRILEGAGYRVLAAADGETALRTVDADRPDLVVLDIGLPGMDGLEVCARLRSEPRNATLPIIMLTARMQLDDIVTGLGAGADDYLAKPFRQPELLARIRSALRLRDALLRMETAHAVVATLANAVEAKDPITEYHCQRLAFLSARLTSRVGVSHTEAETIA